MPRPRRDYASGRLPTYDAAWDILPTPLGPSSVLVYAAYRRSTHTLELGFLSGAIYRYYGVTPRRALYLINQAPSKGRYFNRAIRREYAWARVSGPTTRGRRRKRA